LGHRVISRLAEGELNPKAKAAIAALLEPGETIAAASLWPDQHRRELPATAPWHYVDVPLHEPRYNSLFSGDRPDRGYVVDKIHDFKLILRDPARSVEERTFALRFLIHCIEDLHMPMHVGDNADKGGNQTQVRFYDQGTNMHWLWDSLIIEHYSDNEDRWLSELASQMTPTNRTAWIKGTVEDWATESLLAARQAYLVPETGKPLKPGEKLGDAYQAASLPVIRQRLVQASVRLARVLNEVFPAE
jgi:hypothetical protein